MIKLVQFSTAYCLYILVDYHAKVQITYADTRATCSKWVQAELSDKSGHGINTFIGIKGKPPPIPADSEAAKKVLPNFLFAHLVDENVSLDPKI